MLTYTAAMGCLRTVMMMPMTGMLRVPPPLVPKTAAGTSRTWLIVAKAGGWSGAFCIRPTLGSFTARIQTSPSAAESWTFGACSMKASPWG